MLRIIRRPPVTPPWSSLLVYTLLLSSSIVALIDVVYYHYVHRAMPAWAAQSTLVIEGLNAVGSALLLLLAGNLRFDSPQTLGGAVSDC